MTVLFYYGKRIGKAYEICSSLKYFLVMCNQMRNRNYNDGAVLHWKNDKEIFWKKMENGIGNHIYDYMKLEFMLIPNKFV